MSWHDREQELRDFKVTFLRETDRALLVKLEDKRELWCPKSVVHDDSEIYGGHEEGETGTLIVHEWFAVKNDW